MQLGHVVQTCCAVFQDVGFDSEEWWWQVAVRKRRTVFGSWMRESVVGDGGVEFDPSGGVKKEEEGCVAVVAVEGPSLETPCHQQWVAVSVLRLKGRS